MDRQPDVRIGAIERTLQGVGNAVVALVAQHPDELGDEHVTHLDTPKPHAATKDTRSGRGERKGAMGGYALTPTVSKETLGRHGGCRDARPGSPRRRSVVSYCGTWMTGHSNFLTTPSSVAAPPWIAASTSAALSRSPLPFAS